MKKTLILGYMFIIALSCRAQVIPVEQMRQYQLTKGYIPKGTYLKDVNNLFAKYTGTWKTTYKSRNYTFVIAKTDDTDDYYNIKKDRLTMGYLVTELDGTVLEDTRNLTKNNIYGRKFSNTADYYQCTYYGKNAKCGAEGDLALRSITPTQITLFLTITPSIRPQELCVGIDNTKDVMYPLTETLTLTKQ
jgi:hypothetical protein